MDKKSVVSRKKKPLLSKLFGTFGNYGTLITYQSSGVIIIALKRGKVSVNTLVKIPIKAIQPLQTSGGRTLVLNYKFWVSSKIAQSTERVNIMNPKYFITLK